jgi:hypothetical protein
LRGWEEGAWPQHEVVFEAIASAASALAHGGYFVVLDSLIRPRYLDIVSDHIRDDGIELHYVVLRPSLLEVQSRSERRDERDRHEDVVLEELYGAFGDLGVLGSHAIDNSTLDEDQTVEAIQTKLNSGELRLGPILGDVVRSSDGVK